jgi:hypothetical protein
MRDMNADRASMMKNRPLRNREDEGRECARALNNATATLSASFALRETTLEPGDFHVIPQTPLQSPHCSHR